MPVLILYMLKCALCLAVTYTFYYLVLRRITFYSWNRWYLLGYSALSFIIPFINISPFMNKEHIASSEAITYIPAIGNLSQSAHAIVKPEYTLTVWDVTLIVLAAGVLFMLCRVAIQFVSFARLKRKATLISGSGAEIYQVNRDIIPFSFGKAIYLNKNLHTDKELEKIILHEYVHVKQNHTLDILIAELLCIVNWFNPFAWLIRHSIRQNLEYIADDKVVQSGIDRKTYQYHLLKVVGVPQYRIANQFNFSSLKKRIAMMNKIKSAKAHLLKFLFLLPLVSVTLLAFRNEIVSINTDGPLYAVIFYDLDTHQPIPGVEVSGIYDKKIYTAWRTGYLTIPLSLKDNIAHMSLNIYKPGYVQEDRRFQYVFADEPRSLIELIGLRKGARYANCSNCFLSVMQPSPDNGDNLYQTALGFYSSYLKVAEPKLKIIKMPLAIGTDTTPAKPMVKFKGADGKNIAKPADESAHLYSKEVFIDSKTGTGTFFGKAEYHSKNLSVNADTIKVDTGRFDPKRSLVFIDGKEASLNNIPVEEIESISILKGNDATSQYGSKAKNGVLLIKLNHGGATIIHDPVVVPDPEYISSVPLKISPVTGVRVNSQTYTPLIVSDSAKVTGMRINGQTYIVSDNANATSIHTGIGNSIPLNHAYSIANVNTLVYLIYPENLNKDQDDAMIKKFKDNGFILTITRKNESDGTPHQLLVKLVSKNMKAAATFDIDKMQNKNFDICIAADKQTGRVSVTSDKLPK